MHQRLEKNIDDHYDDVDNVDVDTPEMEGGLRVGPGEEKEFLNEETRADSVSVETTDTDSSDSAVSNKSSSEKQAEEKSDVEGGQVEPTGLDGNLESDRESKNTNDPSFSDDEDEDDDDDEDEDDDEDDDEDEDEESNSKKNLILIYGGAILALIIVGALIWYFISDDVGDRSNEENTGIPKVAVEIAPKIRQPGGLNALIARPDAVGTNSLPTQTLAPVIEPTAFASIPPPNVTDSPLGESNYPDLSEESPHGLLPVIAEDGREAWIVYAKPFVNQSPNPRVSIVVMGLGQSISATNAAINLLPGSVTLAFDPYAPNLSDWMKKARAAGHEVMLMVPLEPGTFPYDDPGPLSLMTANAPEENRNRLKSILGLTTGYVGVMTIMGSKFNTSEKHLRLFLEALKERGLMLLEGVVNSETLAPKIATEIGLPWAVTDLVIDSIPTKTEVDNQLAELETILVNKTAVVAIAEAYPTSIERIGAWIAGLSEKKFVLAPLSALANKQVKK